MFPWLPKKSPQGLWTHVPIVEVDIRKTLLFGANCNFGNRDDAAFLVVFMTDLSFVFVLRTSLIGFEPMT